METTKQKALLKHFSSVLRRRALNESSNYEPIDPIILRYLTRKELIEIIKSKFDNTIPKEVNLMELENEELLEIIGDDMFIIAHCTKDWVVQVAQKETAITMDQKSKMPVINHAKAPKNGKTTELPKQTKSD